MLLRSLLLTFGVSICTLTSLWAQPQSLIDSLTLRLEEETDSFIKSSYAYQIGVTCMDTDPQKGLEYSKLAIRLLPQDSITNLAKGYNILGINYAQLYPDSLSVSIDYFKKALVLFEQVGLDEFVGDSYLNLANAYTLLTDYELALEVLYKAKEKYELTKSYQNLSSVHSVLASINIQQGDYEQGVHNAQQQLFFLLEGSSRDSSLHQKPSRQIAFALQNIGLSYLKMRQLDSSEHYLLKALDLFKKIEYKNYIFTTTNLLADTYIFKDDLVSAQHYLLKILALDGGFLTTRKKLNAQNSLANLYHKQKKYNKSIALYKKNLSIAKAEKIFSFQVMTLKSMAESYARKGNTDKAYKLLVETIPLSDSIVNKDRDQAIEDLEVKYATRYESEKKERENLLLTQELDIQTMKAANQEQLMYGIFGVLILIVIIFVLILRQNRIETNRRMQQLNYQLLLNQMSPHFIFNALTAIQSFVYKNDPRKAGKYLSSFAKLMRAILENSRSEYISLAKELQWLDNYLRLQALRFNNKFEYEVIVDEELEVDGVLLPPMLTQPFIENAIEHGIKDLEVKGMLTIHFKLEDEQLAVYIKDNGVGFDVIQPKKSNHISLATKITKERLGFLNQGNQNKIGFNISSVPNMGTAVSFSIPVQYS